ncbi:1-acyl-sn-glycerol-3-phosphate acyltransferases [Singulisphaera sp. GP187]|uniref:1-acyl-sn-glycerol-3-phosphate acyltransferase n=1 Tax=Singulisphaera sp. GP187 TaxID=1882752 RepID=UPI0009270B1F|nr:1-acyl-sn-glycerol-3-phosphate acyltransferase [Singulisphaera sp. GP187]SIO60942.1 1-acyl-sn-glycerol-3-phosphate acyltransferases [Singulisphaera sp. GP187]
MSTRDWLLIAVTALAFSVLTFFAFLPWIVQPLFRLLLFPHYRLKIRGLHHVPRTGPVLFVANHVSWVDGFILAASCPRRGRILVNADFLRQPVLGILGRRAGLIPVPFSGGHTVRTAIRAAQETLDQGDAVGLFPEAQITRTGLLGPFYRGLEVILKGRDPVPVIPVFLDNLWGSRFSFAGGRFFAARSSPRRRTVNVVFDAPIPPPITRFTVRQAVLVAGVLAVEQRDNRPRPLETLDPSLPQLTHPELGPLTGSTADVHLGPIHQIGHKPGSVGLPLPGIALRVVGAHGSPLPPEREGRLQTRIAGRQEWLETGLQARFDHDGFVYLSATASQASTRF